MREALIKTQRYMKKLEKDPDGTAYDAKCEALIPVLRRELTAHIHCHPFRRYFDSHPHRVRI